jgi:hypothetical protein
MGGIGFAATRGGESSSAKTTTTAATTSTTVVATPPSSFKLPPLVPTTAGGGTVPPPPTTVLKASPTVALTDLQASAVVLGTDEVEAATGQSGWTTAPFEAGPDLCGITSPNPALEYHEVAVRAESSNAGVAVHTAAFTYVTVAEMQQSTAALREAVTACPNPTSVENGVTYTLTFTELNEQAPPLMDSAIAFGVLATAAGQPPVTNVFAVATKGRSAVSLQYQIVGRVPNPEDGPAAEALLSELLLNFITELP